MLLLVQCRALSMLLPFPVENWLAFIRKTQLNPLCNAITSNMTCNGVYSFVGPGKGQRIVGKSPVNRSTGPEFDRRHHKYNIYSPVVTTGSSGHVASSL